VARTIKDASQDDKDWPDAQPAIMLLSNSTSASFAASGSARFTFPLRITIVLVSVVVAPVATGKDSGSGREFGSDGLTSSLECG
jgi:hypothetical protein